MYLAQLLCKGACQHDDEPSATIMTWYILANTVQPSVKAASDLFALARKLRVDALAVPAAVYLEAHNVPSPQRPEGMDEALQKYPGWLSALKTRMAALKPGLYQHQSPVTPQPPLGLQALDLVCEAGALSLVRACLALHAREEVAPVLPNAFVRAAAGAHLEGMRALVDFCGGDTDLLGTMITCANHAPLLTVATRGSAETATFLIERYRACGVDALVAALSFNNHAALRTSAIHGRAGVLAVLLEAYSVAAVSGKAASCTWQMALSASTHEAFRTAAQSGHAEVVHLLLDCYRQDQASLTEGLGAMNHQALRNAALAGHVGVFDAIRSAYPTAELLSAAFKQLRA